MNKTILSLAAALAFIAAATVDTRDADVVDPIVKTAKHGADDPAGDDRGNHGPGHKAILAKHGADDPAGDDRGNHGPGHKAILG